MKMVYINTKQSLEKLVKRLSKSVFGFRHPARKIYLFIHLTVYLQACS